jgi:hypothetical protein
MAILVAGWIPDRASFSSFLPSILESWKIRFLPKVGFGCFIGGAAEIKDALQDWAARADPRPDRIVLITCCTSGTGLSESIRELCKDWHASIPFTLIPIFLQSENENDIIGNLPPSDCLEMSQPVLLGSINSAGRKLAAVELESAALELVRAFVLADHAEYPARDFASQGRLSALALRLMFGDKAAQSRRLTLEDYNLFCLHHSDPNKPCGDIPLWEPRDKASSISIPVPPKMSLYSPSKFEEWLHEKKPGDEDRRIQNAINKTISDFAPVELFREFGETRHKIEASLPQWASELNDFLRQFLTSGGSLTSLEQSLKKRRDQLEENPTPVPSPPLTSRLAADVARRLLVPAAAARLLASLYQQAQKSWKLLAWPAAGGFLAGSLLIGRLVYSWFAPGLETLAWSSLASGLAIGAGTSLLVRYMVLAYRREAARKSYALLRERLDGEFRLLWQNWLRGSAAWLDYHLSRYGAGYCASILQERIERLEDYRCALEAFPKETLDKWAFPAFAEQSGGTAHNAEHTAEHEEEALKFMGSRIFGPFPSWTDREEIISSLWRTLDERVEELATEGGAHESLSGNAEELFRTIRTSALAQSRSIDDEPALRWLLRPQQSQVTAPAGIEISVWQRNDVHLCIALFPFKSDAAKKAPRGN